MKKIIISLLSLVSLVASAQDTFKIICMNIHAGYDASMHEIASFLKEQNPDIVMLQEVDFYTDRSVVASNPRSINNNINMLLEISNSMGMQGMFFPALEKVYGGKYGNAILSKYCFDATARRMLPCVLGTEQRCVGEAVVTLRDRTQITLLSTHLDMAKSDNGLNQIRLLNTLPTADYLFILGGDLNKRTGTEHITLLTDVWTLGVSNEFDHIAFYPKNRWTVIDSKVFSHIKLSDHSPIMLTLRRNQ